MMKNRKAKTNGFASTMFNAAIRGIGFMMGAFLFIFVCGIVMALAGVEG